MMSYSELSALVQKRANEAHIAEQAAKKLSPMKRKKAIDAAYKMTAATQIAADILGESVPDSEKEERIKGLFLIALN